MDWKNKRLQKKYNFKSDTGKISYSKPESESESDIEIKNAKEYENNILKFEGEYLNDERNGKGKEYDSNGKIIFEGYFLKGDRRSKNNKKDDADYYILEYEGEILEGKRNGKGKEYDES